MKIIVVTDSVTRRAGGLFDAVRDMFSNIAFKKIDFRILSYYDEFIKEDLHLWNDIPIKLFTPLFFLYSNNLKKELMSSCADIYHQEGLWRYSNLLMSVWTRKTGKPVVCTPHGMLDPFIIKKQGKLKRIISNLFFQKNFDSVSCYQALCRKELEDIRNYGIKQPIAIIPNGINLPEASKVYSKTDTKKHLLFLGRLHEKKGVDLLLNAFALIYRQTPDLVKDWHVDLVGWDHENCRIKLERIVEKYSIQNYVTFHGGLYGEDKERMYATCDAYILPSHGEGLPMTVLEAWSWKKPVLITPECHFPEGYEVDAAIKIEDNIDSVRRGLETLFTMNDSELKAKGENGYNLVRNQFTWDKSAQKLIQIYEWLLGGEKPEFVYV